MSSHVVNLIYTGNLLLKYSFIIYLMRKSKHSLIRFLQLNDNSLIDFTLILMETLDRFHLIRMLNTDRHTHFNFFCNFVRACIKTSKCGFLLIPRPITKIWLCTRKYIWIWNIIPLAPSLFRIELDGFILFHIFRILSYVSQLAVQKPHLCAVWLESLLHGWLWSCRAITFTCRL